MLQMDRQTFKMNYQYLLIIVGLTLSVATSHFDLPEIIYEICPYSDICNRTASKSLKVKGLVPCCSSCKCDDQCGLRLDCCFDELDKYRLKDKGIVECVHPVIEDEKNTDFHDGYWMIQTCKNETEHDFQNGRNVPCKLNDVKGQSLLEPVSSKEKNYIYVNAECAKCNNVHNFIKWNYMFLGHHYQVGPSAWDSKNNIEKLKRILYIPPLTEDWSMKRCFRKFADKCNTNSTFGKLCGIIKAPFQQNRGPPYRNPICAWCVNQHTLRKECTGQDGRTSYQFTVLIDISIIAYSKLRKNVLINTSLKPDCSNEKTVLSGSCFQIYCPNGMLMTQTGCRYFIKRWYTSAFKIQFKLWAIGGQQLLISTLNALTQAERTNPLLWMKLPCRKVKATVVEVFYEIGKDGQTMVDSLIVRLRKLTPGGLDPSVLIPTLHNCLKNNWYLEISGETYTFYPTLDKDSYYIQDGQQKRSNKLTREREEVPRSKIYKHIATGPGSLIAFNRAASTPVLKTFFCNQISLQMDEVEVMYGEMRILSKNITLGNNEFAINIFTTKTSDDRIIPDVNRTTFSICLEDYDSSYYQKRNGSAMSLRAFLFKQLVVYYSIIHLIM